MSEQSEQGVQNQESGTGVDTAPQIDVNELAQRVEQLESSKARLLEESKTWKSKYQSAKAEQEQKETQAMQESNDFKGLYEKAQQDVMELKQRIESDKTESLKSSLRYEVAKNAKDAQDVDLLVNVVAGSDLIAYDHEAKQWKGITDAVGAARKEKSFLFDRERVGLANGRPANEPPKEKSVREKLAEDPNAVLNDVLGKFLKD